MNHLVRHAHGDRLRLWLYVSAISSVFAVAFWPVVVGRDTLIAGDVPAADWPPWLDPRHPAVQNGLLGDPLQQMLPWLTLVRDAFVHLRWPLWNEYSGMGTPLLANDQSAALSPFTWMALPFPPAWGISVAMLAKLWVAGVGMAVFVRQLGGAGMAGAVAGVGYATSSYMVVWLGWQHTSVAALMPWAFAGVEYLLRCPGRRAVALLASAVALQFLAGHAETSLQLGTGLILYSSVRVVGSGDRRRRFAWLCLAAAIGTMAAAAQVLPFLSELRDSALIASRLASHTGQAHLPLADLYTWVVPNGKGSPALDDPTGGPVPNYNEGAAFVGVATLVLGALGMVAGWRRQRSAVVGLIVVLLVGLGMAYGPLSDYLGRLPPYSASANQRFVSLACLSLAALAGLGVEAISARNRVSRRGWLLLPAVVVTGALMILALLFLADKSRVSRSLGHGFGFNGFWVAVAAAAGTAALLAVCAALLGAHPRWCAALAGMVVLVEGALLSLPYNPRVWASSVAARNGAITWLIQHGRADYISARGSSLLPNMAIYYRLHDVRTYDIVVDARAHAFWEALAPPALNDAYLAVSMLSPDAAWLRAVGVKYYMNMGATTLPGTTAVYTGNGVTIGEVPGARPFAFMAPGTVPARSFAEATTLTHRYLAGPVVVEGGRQEPAPAPGTVRHLSWRRSAGSVDVDADVTRACTLVILQSFTSDWVATVDGRHAALRPANIMFQSVSLPPGRHMVSLRYQPVSFVIGLVLSGVAVAVIAALLAWPALVRAGRTALARHR